MILACPGCGAAWARSANGAPLVRDRQGLCLAVSAALCGFRDWSPWRSRFSSAPLRCAPRCAAPGTRFNF